MINANLEDFGGLPGMMHESAKKLIRSAMKKVVKTGVSPLHGIFPVVSTGALFKTVSYSNTMAMSKDSLIPDGPLDAESMKAAMDEMKKRITDKLEPDICALEMPPFIPASPFIHTINWKDESLSSIVFRVMMDYGVVRVPEEPEWITNLVDEIEQRLPDDFTENRRELAAGLLQAECTFELKLADFDRKWNNNVIPDVP